jgi:hypothetical protein
MTTYSDDDAKPTITPGELRRLRERVAELESEYGRVADALVDLAFSINPVDGCDCDSCRAVRFGRSLIEQESD